MADKVINTKVRQRYDTEANWKSKDPVLLSGEIAISSDKNGMHKVGNGTAKWSALSYSKAKLDKNDVTSALGYTPPTSDTWRGIQNNLTSDATDQSLSAAQGKVLKGLVDNLDSSKLTHVIVRTPVDWNTLTTTGIYHIQCNCSLEEHHAPTANHGTLFVDFSIGTPYQIWMPDMESKFAYKRTCSSNTWNNWNQLWFTDTNTWRGIQNNLTSDSTTDSLSAAQGKALKSLVDGKAASSHTHDDRYYTESEMNAKLAAKADTTVSDLNVIQATRNINSAITPNGNSIASSPFARDLWHDHLAFLNTHTIVSNQITTNGTTWSNDNLNLKPLFQQKECLTTAILSTNIKARRFTLNSPNIAWSNIAWFEFGVSYTNPFSNFSVLIEKSTDNSTWIKIAEATIENNCIPFYIANNGIAEEPYIRFTLTKTTNITTGSVCLTCIKGLSNRKGNQGLGIEFEFPYDWDADRNIYPYGNGQKNLGDTSRKWANVYANNFVGNAATATNASKVNNHTVNSDVPSGAKFTDTIYTHPSYTAKASGLYKVTVDGTGHVSAANAVTKSDITALGIPGSDTNTWRPLGTTADTACAGNDSRLSNARPANGGNASTVNGHTVNADVPENAKFTDTTYSVATISAAGLMSVYDKTNLTNVVNAQSSSYFTQDEINDLFS